MNRTSDEPALAIVADDLTGSADSGAPFARRGLSTEVAVTGEPLQASTAPSVLVINTDGRDRTPKEASHLVAGAVQGALTLGYPTVYKKHDSLFRGNVGAELEAAMDALGCRVCLLAPAFPAQGRITKNGRCFVHGRELGEHDIATLLSRSASRSLSVTACGPRDYRPVIERELRRSSPGSRRVVIADAWERRHLEELAGLWAELSAGGRSKESPALLPAGSGGFAGALAEVLGPGSPAAPAERSPALRYRGVLIISGSRSVAAAAQLERLAAALDITLARITAPLSSAVSSLAETIASGGIAVAATEPGREIAHAAPRVAALAAEVLSQDVHPFLIFVGGETAMATLREIGASRFRLFGEVEEGIALGELPETRFGTFLAATKAGAFGDAETLLRVVEGRH